jgi:hypothetical protein
MNKSTSAALKIIFSSHKEIIETLASAFDEANSQLKREVGSLRRPQFADANLLQPRAGKQATSVARVAITSQRAIAVSCTKREGECIYAHCKSDFTPTSFDSLSSSLSASLYANCTNAHTHRVR